MPCYQVLRRLCPGDKGAQAKSSRGPGRDGSWGVPGAEQTPMFHVGTITGGSGCPEWTGVEPIPYTGPVPGGGSGEADPLAACRALPSLATVAWTWERYPASGRVAGTEGLPGGQTERISIHTLCFPGSDQESIPGSRSHGAASLRAARPVPGFGAPAQRPLCPTAGPEACPPPSPPGPAPPAGHPRAEVCMLPAPARRAQPQPCGSPPPTLSVRGLSTRPPSSTSAGQELDTCSGQFASRYPAL